MHRLCFPAPAARPPACVPRAAHSFPRRGRAPLALALGAALLAAAVAGALAEDAAPVEVESVSYRAVADPGGNGRWGEWSVQLIASGGSGAAQGRWVEDVSVALWVGGAPLSAGSGPQAQATRHAAAAARVDCLGLGRSTLRWYLPPEWVARDEPSPAQLCWLVTLNWRGRPLPWTPAQSPPGWSEKSARAWRSRFPSGRSGVNWRLLPQARTPYAWDPARPSPTQEEVSP